MTSSRRSQLAGIVASIAFGAIAIAGQTGNAGASKADAPADTSKDDILILVNLRAKELKFDKVADPKVEFPGTGERSTVWVTDRFNIPDKVEPGVTYRDIGITLRISSRFADIDRIVREALGEDAGPAPSAALSAAGDIALTAPHAKATSPSVALPRKKIQ